MAVWLYQMTADNYSPEEYRAEIWEGGLIKWPSGKISSKSGYGISPGDIVVLVYVKSGAQEPGIFGWGIIVGFNEEKGHIVFRPVYPSDFLKMCPIWDADVSALLDSIRGPVKVGTIWEISNVDAEKIKQKIHEWVK